jgi:hypothetical protein
VSAFNLRLEEALVNIALTESIKTDFFDMYRILSSPYQDDSDMQSLLEDRVDRLYDYFLDILYKVIIFRATHASAFIEDSSSHLYGMHDIFLNNYVGMMNTKGTEDRANVVRKYASAFLRYGSWIDVLKMFYDMASNESQNANKKAVILDKFFGLTHNNGSIIDYFHLLNNPDGYEVPDYRIPINVGWLEDALYVRTLADFNTLGDHSSKEVRDSTVTAAYGLEKNAIDQNHKSDIRTSKQQRIIDLTG